MQKLIVDAKPMFNLSKVPDNKYLLLIYRFVTHPKFDPFILLCIMINIVLMALVYEGASESYLAALYVLNLVFTTIFIIECILKLLGFGLNGYFFSTWNKFDFFVVTCSLLDLYLVYYG